MERPWVTPADVKEYSDSDKVINKPDSKLRFDIARAESYVIYHTHNEFDDEKYEDNIPDDIKMAVILLAESYCVKTANQIAGVKASETFDDYSYTLDNSSDIIENLQLGPLLSPYIIEDKGKAIMHLRKL